MWADERKKMEELVELLLGKEKYNPNQEEIRSNLLKKLMEELEYLKYWLTEEEVQQVLAKGNKFMFKYLILCMQLLEREDQKRGCIIKNPTPNPTRIIIKIPKNKVAPGTSTDQEIVRTSTKRKVVFIDHNNSQHRPCIRKAREHPYNVGDLASTSTTISFEYHHETVDQYPRKRLKKPTKKVKKDLGHVTAEVIVELPRVYMEKIREMKGREVKLIAEKMLECSDVKPSLNRLMLPVAGLLNKDFLTDDEKAWLQEPHRKIKAQLIDPWEVDHGPKGYDKVINMGKWKMRNCYVYALVSPWRNVVSRNQFVKGDVIQVWSFRVIEEDANGVHNHDEESPGAVGLAIVRTRRAPSNA